MKLLGPIIEERQKYLDEYGAAWDDKPVRYFRSVENVLIDMTE